MKRKIALLKQECESKQRMIDSLVNRDRVITNLEKEIERFRINLATTESRFSDMRSKFTAIVSAEELMRNSYYRERDRLMDMKNILFDPNRNALSILCALKEYFKTSKNN